MLVEASHDTNASPPYLEFVLNPDPEIASWGVAGPLGLPNGVDRLRFALKATGELHAARDGGYRYKIGELEEWANRERALQVVVPHGCASRFEFPLDGDSRIIRVRQGLTGAQWWDAEVIRCRKFAGQTAVGKKIILAPHIGENALEPPRVAQGALLIAITETESLNAYHPDTRLQPGESFVCVAIGESALIDLSMGYGTVEQMAPVFNPTRFRTPAYPSSPNGSRPAA